MSKSVISADSHVTEHPGAYTDNIEIAYRDRAPHLVDDGNGGQGFLIPGLEYVLPMGLIAAAGSRPEDIGLSGSFDDWHRSGWDPKARLADQDTDGIAAEVLYPTVGMMVCNMPDLDLKKACMDAYNRWIAAYVSECPERLLGIGQTALRTPEEGVDDLRAVKEAGLRGVMIPGHPGQADYDDRRYDPFWEACVDLGMPVSFHVLTSKDEFSRNRGPVLNFLITIIRSNQDIISTLIFGGVFDRFPELKVICVEADAGWAPHYMYRMDHFYNRHRHALDALVLKKMPSDYFKENVYVTFQDDWVAFKMINLLDDRRVMWANDFPHSDSTWPNSQAILAEHTAGLTSVQKDRILHDNVAGLYGLSV